MPTSITDLAPAPLSLTALLLNLIIGAVLSLVLGWHFQRFGRSLTNRTALARILPFITLTTVLIISVVKSSLALSLGLVGALSIVRFRTPIKDPEELAYLFMAIAIGLTLGADQILAAIVAAPLIMALIAAAALTRGRRRDDNLYLNFTLAGASGARPTFEQVTAALEGHVTTADVRRMDVSDDAIQVTCLVQCAQDSDIVNAMDHLQKTFPAASISFVEQQNFLGG